MKKSTDEGGQDKIDPQSLKESEARLRSIFFWSQDAIIVTDAKGKIEYMNPAAERVFNRKLESFIGKDFGLPLVDGESTEIDIFRPGKDLGVGDMRVVEIEWLNEKAFLITIRDITERRKAEEALRETTEYLNNLITYANAPIIVWDAQFRITQFNHAFESLTGRKAKDVLGKSLDFLFPPALVDNSISLIRKTLSEQRWEGVEIDIQHIDGSVRTVIWNSAKILAEDGKTVAAIIAQGQDITERKKAEEELKKAKISLDLAIAASQIGVWELDLIKDTSVRNLRHDQIFGYKEKIAEWGEKIFFEHIITEDRPSVQAAFDRAMKTDRLYFECRILWPDETIHWITATGKVVRDSAGKPQEMFGTVTDITERKKAEEALRHEKELAQTYLDIAAFIMLIINKDGTVSYVNEKGCDILGYEKEDIIGKNWFDNFLPKSKKAEVKEIFLRLFHGEAGLFGYFEDMVITATGEERLIGWNNTMLRDDEGRATAALISGEDITERKKAEELMKRSEERFKVLFEFAPDAYFLTDLKGALIDGNIRAEALTGYNRDEMKGGGGLLYDESLVGGSGAESTGAP